MKKRFLFYGLVLFSFLSACNIGAALATTTPLPPSITPALPTASALPPAPKTSIPASPAVPTQALPVVYYAFIPVESSARPAGSVVILKDVLILGPALSKFPRSPDSSVNLALALQAVIQDPRNAWKSDNMKIANMTLKDGMARVTLQGELQAPGDIVLIAARMQILLTIFSEPAVQSAVVTLNGQNIANLGISHSSQERPVGAAFTRAEIEAFLKENQIP